MKLHRITTNHEVSLQAAIHKPPTGEPGGPGSDVLGRTLSGFSVKGIHPHLRTLGNFGGSRHFGECTTCWLQFLQGDYQYQVSMASLPSIHKPSNISLLAFFSMDRAIRVCHSSVFPLLLFGSPGTAEPSFIITGLPCGQFCISAGSSTSAGCRTRRRGQSAKVGEVSPKFHATATVHTDLLRVRLLSGATLWNLDKGAKEIYHQHLHKSQASESGR